MGKLAQGTSIIRLFPSEIIIDAINTPEQKVKDLILITNKGSFIKYDTQKIKVSKKGELGTMGINFKNNKSIQERVINCFLNNQYVYIKTDAQRYEKLNINQININQYKKENKLDIKLNENELIESIFSMILPENN